MAESGKPGFMGQLVRDRRTGLTGRVIGVVEWDLQPPSLIVQPPVRPDQTIPPTAYVVAAAAEIIPGAEPPKAN